MAIFKPYMIRLSLLIGVLMALSPSSFVLAQHDDRADPHLFENKSLGGLMTGAAFADRLSHLTEAADLVAVGSVVDSVSAWNAESGLIESHTRIRLNYRLKGASADEITVRTEGGFLPAAGLGMIAPHEASFAPGETVMVFARRYEGGFQIVDGEAGKFSLPAGDKLDMLLRADGERTTAWQIRHLAVNAANSPVTPVRRWKTPATAVPFKVNLNSAQVGHHGNTAAGFLTAITAAAATWNQAPTADFALTYAGQTTATETSYNGVNEVVFMPKGRGNRAALAQVWFKRDLTIVEADIWINDDYRWAVNGAFDQDALDLQSVLLHEFGHWLVLEHMAHPASVMYPTLATGDLKRTLHPDDIAGINAIYPCQVDACVADR